jgi:putative ABC transport system substrate-binding protein
MACRGFAGAVEVVVVESKNYQVFEDALEGFQSSCGCNTREIVLSETEMSERGLIREILRSRPRLIVAIGTDALSKVKGIKDIPILYLMIPNPPTRLSSAENITGVSMRVSAERQLAKLKEVLPGVKRVGLVYDPSNNDFFVEKAREVSGELGIKLVLEKVDRPQKVLSAIQSIIKEGIDALWMVYDETVIIPDTLSAFLDSSLNNNLPLFTYAPKFLEKNGAVISVSADPVDMGKQAAEMAKRILSGTKPADLPKMDPRKVVLSLNLRTAKMLGITVSSEAIAKAQNIID